MKVAVVEDIVVDNNLDPVEGAITVSEHLQGLWGDIPTEYSWTTSTGEVEDNVGASGLQIKMGGYSALQTFVVEQNGISYSLNTVFQLNFCSSCFGGGFYAGTYNLVP